jgi:hypothetical protein
MIEKDGERQRIMGLYRRGWIAEADVEAQLSEIEREAADIQARLRILAGVRQMAVDMASSLEAIKGLLAGLAERLDQATPEEKRHTVQALVRSIVVETTAEGRKKTAMTACTSEYQG